MCFELGPPAHVYQKIGEFVGTEGTLNKRAEDEQAFMLHKLIGYWLEDPTGWDTAADLDCKRACALLPKE